VSARGTAFVLIAAHHRRSAARDWSTKKSRRSSNGSMRRSLTQNVVGRPPPSANRSPINSAERSREDLRRACAPGAEPAAGRSGFASRAMLRDQRSILGGRSPSARRADAHGLPAFAEKIRFCDDLGSAYILALRQASAHGADRETSERLSAIRGARRG